MKVTIDNMDKAIQAELEQYAYEVRDKTDSAVVRVAKKCLAQIRRDSPRQSKKYYRKGWTMKTNKGRLSTVVVLYNRTRWFLTHLLEYGHQKADGGRVDAIPHIEPVAQQAEKELVAELTRVLRER